MNSWPPHLDQSWWVATRSSSLRARPLPITVMSHPLVLARLADGSVLALEDRCPHRQAPLSAGHVHGDGIACPYHGWRFGADGRLLEQPGLPAEECPPQVRARVWQVREHDDLVWVRRATESTAELPAIVTDLPAGSRRFLWQTHWRANALEALENFLDPLHTHCIHPGIVRREGQRRRVTARVTIRADGLVVDYLGQPEQSGWLYRLFESPRSSERAIYAALGVAQIEYGYISGAVVRITLYFTPETATSTHVFASLHVENRWAPSWAVRAFVWPWLKRVAEQDRHVVELQAANMARFPGKQHAVTPQDLVRRHLQDFWQGTPPAAGIVHDQDLML